MPFSVTRSHEIHCGHRVYGHEGKCRNLHGHSYVFHLTCEAEELDGLGRVIDFSVIKARLCQWLEENWDHRTLIWEQDPILAPLRQLDATIATVPFNPTAENIAAYMVEHVGPRQLEGTGVRLASVKVEETGKCSATFSL